MSDDDPFDPIAFYEDLVCKNLAETIGEDEVRGGEFEALFQGLLTEPDRVFVIVAYSYVDQRMKELLTLAINPRIGGGTESLFGALGPLGSSSSRLQMAAALYWLDDSTYRDLSALRKMRNEFAHSPFVSELSTQRLVDLLASMNPIETQRVANLSSEFHSRGVVFSNSERLRARTIFAAARMIAELLVSPHAIRSSIRPLAPLQSKKWFPPALRILWTKAVALADQELHIPAGHLAEGGMSVDMEK